MITRISSLGCFHAAFFLVSILWGGQHAEAQNRTRPKPAFSQDRIDISHARPAAPHSLLSRAAHGQAISELPPRALNGSLVNGNIQQVGFLDGCAGNCGPVCDCGVEYIEPGCGCGMEVGCGCGIEAGCGLEIIEPGCGCGMEVGCGCGIEAGCGLEIVEPGCGCGLEVGCGCGIEAGCGLEIIEPGCGCGMEVGCGCGIETIVEAGCGLDVGCDSGCGVDVGCGCDSCATSCAPCGIGVFLPYLKIDWCRLDLFAGVNGFTGPLNFASVDAANPNSRVAAGSTFGFYEGFNQGRNLKGILGFDLAGQFGIRATQTSLSGSRITDDSRNQVFLTVGGFRRVDYGLQYGLVFDYLNDDWYFQGDVTQLRGEVNWNSNNGHIFGLQFMSGLDGDTSTTNVRDAAGNAVASTFSLESSDQFRVFYRQLLSCGGDWDIALGATDNDDTILSSLINMPLSNQVVFNSGVTYVIANEDEGSTGEDEAWNLSLGFTYRPGGAAGCGRYCRPMFQVADNGTFLLRRR